MRTSIMRDFLLGGLLLAAASVAWAAPATAGLTPTELRAIRHVSRGVLLAKHNGAPSSAQLALQTTIKDLQSAINNHISRRVSHSMHALKARLATGAAVTQTASPIDDSDFNRVLTKLQAGQKAFAHGPAGPTGSLNDSLRKLDEQRAAHLEREVRSLLATKGKTRLSQLLALRKKLEARRRTRATFPAEELPAPTLSMLKTHRP